MSLDDAMNKPEEEVVETTETPVTEPVQEPVQEPAPEVIEPVETTDTAVVDPIDSLDEEPEALPQLTEIEVLRKRADQLGLKYRSNTGVEKLRALVNAKVDGTTPPVDEEDEEEAAVGTTDVEPAEETPLTESPTSEELLTEPEAVRMAEAPTGPIVDEVPVPTELTAQQKRVEARKEARKLVRVRITCHNPGKSEWEGEIFTFGNGVVGTLKRYVPYDTEWHVEQAIFNMIRGRKYQHFYTIKNDDGRPVRTSKLVNEFSSELLDPLTEQELKDLAQRQAMAAGTQE